MDREGFKQFSPVAQRRLSEWTDRTLIALRKSKGFDRGGVALEVYELANSVSAR